MANLKDQSGRRRTRAEQGATPQGHRMRQSQGHREKSLGQQLENDWEALKAKLDEIAASCRSATEKIDEIIGLLKRALGECRGSE